MKNAKTELLEHLENKPKVKCKIMDYKEKHQLTRVELLRLKKNAENLYNYRFLKKSDYINIIEDVNDWLLIRE